MLWKVEPMFVVLLRNLEEDFARKGMEEPPALSRVVKLRKSTEYLVEDSSSALQYFLGWDSAYPRKGGYYLKCYVVDHQEKKLMVGSGGRLPLHFWEAGQRWQEPLAPGGQGVPRMLTIVLNPAISKVTKGLVKEPPCSVRIGPHEDRFGSVTVLGMIVFKFLENRLVECFPDAPYKVRRNLGGIGGREGFQEKVADIPAQEGKEPIKVVGCLQYSP